MNSSKFVHDINAAISALGNALEIIEDKIDSDPELVKKMIPLCREKSEELANDWKEFKDLLSK